MSNNHLKIVKSTAVNAVRKIKSALSNKQMAVSDLAEIVHLAPKTVRRYVAFLREEKEVYICGYSMVERKNGKDFPVPLYCAGSSKDLEYDAPTKLARDRKYKAKLKRDPERYRRYLAKARAARIKPVAQPELSFFFGRTA